MPTQDSALASLPDVVTVPLTPLRLLTSWTFDPAMLIPLAVAAAAYLWGVRVLRRRGDEWSRNRTLLWFTGLALVFLGTSSSVGVYDRVLFMMPAIQHMVLQMIAPVPLVAAAPMTLALRTVPSRWRAVLLAVVHSGPVRFLGHPGVTYLIFAVNQFLYYYTPLYEASMRNVPLHDFLHWHFVLVGALFYWSLLGIDPVPHRPPFLFRFLLVVGLAPIHILLGIPIMMMDTLVAGDYYLALGRDWGLSMMRDQYVGGGILWAFGDVSAAVLVAVFIRQWYRSDEREARRTDRQIDRIYGTGPTVKPWWLLDDQDAADVLGPQRDSERSGWQHGPEPWPRGDHNGSRQDP